MALTYSRQDKDSTWAYSQCPLGEFSPQTHQPPRGSLHPWAPVTSPLPSHLKELSPAPNALKRRVCAAQRPSRSSTAQRPPRNCSVGPLLHRPLVCAVQSPWKLRTWLLEAFQAQLYVSQKTVPLPPLPVFICETSLALPLILFMLFCFSFLGYCFLRREKKQTENQLEDIREGKTIH